MYLSLRHIKYCPVTFLCSFFQLILQLAWLTESSTQMVKQHNHHHTKQPPQPLAPLPFRPPVLTKTTTTIQHYKQHHYFYFYTAATYATYFTTTGHTHLYYLSPICVVSHDTRSFIYLSQEIIFYYMCTTHIYRFNSSAAPNYLT